MDRYTEPRLRLTHIGGAARRPVTRGVFTGVVAFAFLTLAQTASAAPAPFNYSVTLKASRATSNVISSPTLLETLYVKDTLRIERQAVIAQAEEKTLGDGEFEVRVFPVVDDDSLPKPVKRFSGCDVYVTLVYHGVKFDRGTGDARLWTLNYDWLALVDRRAFAPGHFIMVVEQDARPDASAIYNPWELFRLNASTSPDYFKRGLRFVVTVHEGGGYDAQLVAGEAKRRSDLEDKLSQAGTQVSPRLYCYTLQFVHGSARSAQVATLDKCPVAGSVPYPPGSAGVHTGSGATELAPTG